MLKCQTDEESGDMWEPKRRNSGMPNIAHGGLTAGLACEPNCRLPLLHRMPVADGRVSVPQVTGTLILWPLRRPPVAPSLAPFV